MITLIIGLIAAPLVLIYALKGQDVLVFLNIHSFVIVVLGTLAVFLLSVPLRNALGLWRNIKDLRKVEPKNKDITDTILKLAKNRYIQVPESVHPLIGFASSMWQEGIDSLIFERLLFNKLEELNSRTEQPIASLRNLSKYPPALGMIGTVMGMVILFANLTGDNKANIGPNLAMAMTATFYGLILANFLIMPLADRMMVRHLSRMKRNESVFNSLVLINREEPSAVVMKGHAVDSKNGGSHAAAS